MSLMFRVIFENPVTLLFIASMEALMFSVRDWSCVITPESSAAARSFWLFS